MDQGKTMNKNDRSAQAAFASVGPKSAGMDLLKLLQIPACLLDGAGQVQSMNDAWRRLVGMRDVPSAGGWVQLIGAEDREAVASHLAIAAPRGERFDIECRLLDAQGQLRWHLLSFQPCHECSLQDADWLCIAMDVHTSKMRDQELQVQARLQTEMLNVGPDCIKLIALDGRLIYANRAGCAALGIPEGTSFGMAWLDLLPPEVRLEGEAALAEVRAGRAARFPGRSVLPGQSPQHWDNMLTPTQGPDNQTPAILCVSREVTAEFNAQESLRRSEQRLAMAASVGGLGVWDYDIRGDSLHCDAVWHRIMGRDPAFPIRSVAEFRPIIHPEDVDRATEIDAAAAEVIAIQGHYKIEFRILRPDGEVRWVRSVASVLQDDDGVPIRAVGFIVDITDARHGELALRETNRALEEERASLTRQSLEDPLTGLANRRSLDNELARVCEQAKQDGQKIAVAMIDVDYFKAYNDRYGHLKGDDALRGVASALKSVARRTDLVARYGGEEFVAIFPDMAQPDFILRRLAAAIEALDIPHGASPLGRLTISCGCVVFDAGCGMTPAEFLAAGDEALYEAKNGGRNRHVIRFHPSAR